jgi:hypothetical protein
MTWKEFLIYHTSRNGRPVIKEAKQWLAEGWSFERVVAEWHVGNDILWAAEGIGVISHDTAVKIAAACVTHAIPLAPDIEAVTDAVWQGDMIVAWHEVEATEAITAVPDDLEAEYTVDPAAMKARFASSLLLSKDMHSPCYHTVQAKVMEARAAYSKALRDGASEEKLQMLAGLAGYVEASEHLAQADFVRWVIGGLA